MGSYAKKIKYLFITTALLGSGIASAADFDVKGSGRFRVDSKDNADYVTADDKTDAYGMRFRLDFNFNPNENVNVFVQPQFVKAMGTTSGQLANTQLDVHQAYTTLKASDNTSVTMGRKEMVYGDHLLMGHVGWSNDARAFDTMKVRHSYGLGWTDVFASSVYKTAATSNESYVYGLYNGWSLDMVKALDVYYLQYSRPLGTPLSHESISTAGLRAKHDYGALDYRFEFASQSFTDTSLEAASLMDLEVGFAFGDDHRVAFEYSSATKDYNQLFPTAHKWLGIADFYSRRNMTSMRVGASTKVAKWGIGLDYHMFNRTDDTAPAYDFGVAAIGAGAGTDKSVASEIDITFKRQLNENYAVMFGMATVTPGDYLKGLSLTEAGNYMFLQTTATF